ncbi:hypothetical protein VTJ49DRAFT_3841 [Mycothermus thermophilus]|uniref:Uncharacterized protein n=1 Tax=Humicola insolens TaxID=85995 RepID=A0ABR3VQI7_HUMIN
MPCQCSRDVDCPSYHPPSVSDPLNAGSSTILPAYLEKYLLLPTGAPPSGASTPRSHRTLIRSLSNPLPYPDPVPDPEPFPGPGKDTYLTPSGGANPYPPAVSHSAQNHVGGTPLLLRQARQSGPTLAPPAPPTTGLAPDLDPSTSTNILLAAGPRERDLDLDLDRSTDLTIPVPAPGRERDEALVLDDEMVRADLLLPLLRAVLARGASKSVDADEYDEVEEVDNGEDDRGEEKVVDVDCVLPE